MDTMTGQLDEEEKKRLYLAELRGAAEVKVNRALQAGKKISIGDFDAMHTGLGTSLQDRLRLKTLYAAQGKFLTDAEERMQPTVEAQAVLDVVKAAVIGGNVTNVGGAEEVIRINPRLLQSLTASGIYGPDKGKYLSQQQVERWLAGKDTNQRMHLKMVAAENGILQLHTAT